MVTNHLDVEKKKQSTVTSSARMCTCVVPLALGTDVSANGPCLPQLTAGMTVCCSCIMSVSSFFGLDGGLCIKASESVETDGGSMCVTQLL